MVPAAEADTPPHTRIPKAQNGTLPLQGKAFCGSETPFQIALGLSPAPDLRGSFDLYDGDVI